MKEHVQQLFIESGRVASFTTQHFFFQKQTHWGNTALVSTDTLAPRRCLICVCCCRFAGPGCSYAHGDADMRKPGEGGPPGMGMGMGMGMGQRYVTRVALSATHQRQGSAEVTL